MKIYKNAWTKHRIPKFWKIMLISLFENLTIIKLQFLRQYSAGIKGHTQISEQNQKDLSLQQTVLEQLYIRTEKDDLKKTVTENGS